MLGLPFSLGAFLSGGLAAGGDAVPQPAHQAQGRRDHRADLHLLLRARPVHGVAVADVGEHPDHRPGQYPGDHAGGHAAARHHRLRLAGGPARQVEGPDGHLLRREPRPLDRPQPDAAARSSSSRCSPASHGRGDADGRRLPRHRHGGDAGRHRLSAHRPLPAADRHRRRDRRDRPASSAPMPAISSTARPAASSSSADADLPRRLRLRPQARPARRPPPRRAQALEAGR